MVLGLKEPRSGAQGSHSMGTFNQQSRHFGCYLLPDLVFLPSFSLGPISYLLFYFIFISPIKSFLD